MTRPKLPAVIRCSWCRTPYESRRPWGYGTRRYCTTRCRVAAWRFVRRPKG